jgi:type IV pilus assembly protein PilB
MSGKLGEILIKDNLINADQLKQALDHQKANGGRLGNSLVKLGFLNDDEVTAVLSRQYGVPSINLAYFEVDPNVTKLIPMDTATKYQVLPLSRVGSSLTLAMVDPTNVFAMDDIKFMTGFNIEPVVASEAAILDAIKKQYGSAEDQERKRELEEIVNFIDEGQAESLELEAEEDGTLNLAALERRRRKRPLLNWSTIF